MNEDVKRNFSELPMDILTTIADKSLSLSDLVWFGAVCNSWRIASLANPKHIKLPSLFPVLLLPSSLSEEEESQNQYQQQQTDDDDDEEDNTEYNYDSEDNDEESKRKTNTITTRSLYSLYDGKVYDWQLRVGGDCRSSSHGWLVVVTTEADQNYSVRLLNPFKSFNNVIELPPLTAFQLEPGTEVWDSAHLRKAVISARPRSNPPRDDIVVMAIHGCYRLSFCRPGDKAWTALPFIWDVCQDVIYYNGLFYAILQSGKLLAIEINPPIHSKLNDFQVIIDVPPGDSHTKYIVESSGELLQVKRKVVGHYKYKTLYFKVFKLDLDKTGFNNEWVEIKTLNGRTLFLGHNASISLSASEAFPGCKPNCIYFTDDNEEIFKNEPSCCGPHDIGIYNLEDGSFEPHYPMKTKAITPHPIWIQPTL